MPIGIAAPTPNGIPGFNWAGFFLRTGATAGVVNATELPSWYNVLRHVPVANGPACLPPATCGGQEVVVWNYSNYVDPAPGASPPTPNTATIYGYVTPEGQQDTIDDGGGNQTTAGVAVAPGEVVLFWCVVPQAGFINARHPGQWQKKLIV